MESRLVGVKDTARIVQGSTIQVNGSAAIGRQALVGGKVRARDDKLTVQAVDGSAVKIGSVAREGAGRHGDRRILCVDGAAIPGRPRQVIGENTVGEGAVCILDIDGSAILVGIVVRE